MSSARRGLSLIEVAIAILLLSVLMGGLFATLNTSMRAEVSTRQRDAASRQMFQQVDVLAVIPFDELQVGADLPAYAFPVEYPLRDGGLVALPTAASYPKTVDDPATPEDESRRAGHVTVVRDPDGNGSDDLLEVRVTVAWRGEDGRDQQLSVSTRRARP